jgi:hypothetical protein
MSDASRTAPAPPAPPARPARPNGAGANGYDGAVVARARRLVEGTARPQADIGAELGVPASTISMWKRVYAWKRPADAPPPPPNAGTRRDPAVIAAARRARLVKRLFRAFDRQLLDVEARLKAADRDSEDKDARVLGTLARTLGTLIALERGDGAAATEPEPIDRERLRADLARRINAWAEAGGEAE